ncbi:hypothetical protein DL765_008923 [Monosporascus sp. GIB2]|nr:hypothetical protein DL765_008923 [Monosporascus sp. GIB2]
MREGTLEGATNVSLFGGPHGRGQVDEPQSFGMHVGSAAARARVRGFPYFGGHDRESRRRRRAYRAADVVRGRAALVDVSLAVTAGGSPFKGGNETASEPGEAGTTRYSGLMAAGNETVGARPGVAVDASAPYLNLPLSTCDAIAAHRPVTYDSDLGLCLWDAGDVAYTYVADSAAALRFTFQTPSSAPTSRSRRTGWRRPAPNIAGEQVMAFESGAHAIEPSNNDWVASWEGTRTPLTDGSGEDGGNDAGSASGGVSGTAIGVGVGVGRHDKGPQACGVTPLGNRGYGPARTGDDSGRADSPAEVGDLRGQQAGEPKTYYGGGGQKPYGETEDPDPVRGWRRVPPQGGGRAAAELGGATRAARGVFGLRDGGR